MPGERTEQASPHRREKARKDGDVLRSKELSSAAGTVAGIVCLGFLGQRTLDGFRVVFVSALNQRAGEKLGPDLKELVLGLRVPMMGACIPVLIAMAAIIGSTVLCGVLQTGGQQINGNALRFRLERINPVANARNLFSLRSASRLGKSLVPAAILAVLAYRRIVQEFTISPFNSFLSLMRNRGGTLLNRVRALRRHLSAEMGFLVPPIHISDNLRLRPREYVFSLRGIEIGRWQLEGKQMLAVSGGARRRALPGKETREPAFGVPAIWIAPELEEQATAAGYSVVDGATVMTTHLGEMIRRNAHELLGRAETKRLMESLNESHPKLLEELVPKVLTLGEVGRVLEQLLRERVSIRDLGTILEALLEHAPVNKNVVALVECARQALGRRLIAPLLDQDGQLPVLLLNGELEEEIVDSLSPESSHRLLRSASAPGVPVVRRLADSLKSLIGSSTSSVLPVLLCPSPARYHVKRWLEPLMPRLAVIAAAEIPPEVRLKPAGTVG